MCRCELHATPQYGYGTLSHGRGPEPKGKLAQEGANPPRGTHTLCCCHAERAHMCQTQAHGEGQALHGISPEWVAGRSMPARRGPPSLPPPLPPPSPRLREQGVRDVVPGQTHLGSGACAEDV